MSDPKSDAEQAPELESEVDKETTRMSQAEIDALLKAHAEEEQAKAKTPESD